MVVSNDPTEEAGYGGVAIKLPFHPDMGENLSMGCGHHPRGEQRLQAVRAGMSPGDRGSQSAERFGTCAQAPRGLDVYEHTGLAQDPGLRMWQNHRLKHGEWRHPETTHC